MTTINPNAEMPMVQGTLPGTITDKKSSVIAAGLSKVGSAALTALKAVGIVFAIVATAGLILANKDFRQMASNFFFGPKVELSAEEQNERIEAANVKFDNTPYSAPSTAIKSKTLSAMEARRTGMEEAQKAAKDAGTLPALNAEALRSHAVKVARSNTGATPTVKEQATMLVNDASKLASNAAQQTAKMASDAVQHVKANGQAYSMAAAGAALTTAAAIASGFLFAASEVVASEVIESTALAMV